MNKLALYGGTPVRETMLNGSYPGASLYGEEEARAAFEICMSRSPFRYYGFQPQGAVNQFEEAFASYIGSKNALGVTSGTAALVVALKAAGIGPGDKVIVPSCTFVATAGAVVCAGAVPIFADVDDSLNIDPKKIGSLCDKYTKALVTVPLLGNPCQMDEIVAECRKHNLLLIEDVAQSMGCAFQGKRLGTWGDAGIFSMQLNKIITTGEGGVVVSDNDDIYERAVRYHDQGQYRKKEGGLTEDASRVLIGQNYRMSELTGAAALAQLRKLDDIIKRMKANKQILKQELSGIDGFTFRRVPDEAGDAGAALVAYLPTKELTQLFNKAMKAENINFGTQYGGRPAYMIPQIFHQKTIDASGFPFNQFDEKIVYTEDMCPVAMDLFPRSTYTFMAPWMSEKDVDDIIKAVKKVTSAIL